MSGDGRSRKRNLLSGGPKTAPSRAKPTASSNTSSFAVTTSTPVVVPDSLASSSSSARSQGRQTRQSTLSQRTLEPFAFSQTRSTAKQKPVIPVVVEDDDDDDIQIIEEPKAKRVNRRKSSDDDAKKEPYAIPDSLTVASGNNKNSERQGTPFTSIQSRKEKKSIPSEIIPDSIAELDEIEEILPTKSTKKNKRNPKQAGLDEGIGEALKAVKKIKLSTPTLSTTTNDLKNNISLKSTIRAAPPGKMFQKARQGSFYFALPTQRISVNEMSVWSGNE